MQLFLSCHAADALPTLARAALEEHFTRPKHGNGPDAAVLLVEACLADGAAVALLWSTSVGAAGPRCVASAVLWRHEAGHTEVVWSWADADEEQAAKAHGLAMHAFLRYLSARANASDMLVKEDPGGDRDYWIGTLGYALDTREPHDLCASPFAGNTLLRAAITNKHRRLGPVEAALKNAGHTPLARPDAAKHPTDIPPVGALIGLWFDKDKTHFAASVLLHFDTSAGRRPMDAGNIEADVIFSDDKTMTAKLLRRVEAAEGVARELDPAEADERRASSDGTEVKRAQRECTWFELAAGDEGRAAWPTHLYLPVGARPRPSSPALRPSRPAVPVMLELFSGEGRVAKAFHEQHGYKVHLVDTCPPPAWVGKAVGERVTYRQEDIATNTFGYPSEAWFDVVWVGFVCTTYCMLARTSHGREEARPKGTTPEAKRANEMLAKVVLLLKQIASHNPDVIIVFENPGGSFIDRQEEMAVLEGARADGGLGLAADAVTHCMFDSSLERRKELRLWHNSQKVRTLLAEGAFVCHLSNPALACPNFKKHKCVRGNTAAKESAAYPEAMATTLATVLAADVRLARARADADDAEHAPYGLPPPRADTILRLPPPNTPAASRLKRSRPAGGGSSSDATSDGGRSSSDATSQRGRSEADDGAPSAGTVVYGAPRAKRDPADLDYELGIVLDGQQPSSCSVMWRAIVCSAECCWCGNHVEQRPRVVSLELSDWRKLQAKAKLRCIGMAELAADAEVPFVDHLPAPFSGATVKELVEAARGHLAPRRRGQGAAAGKRPLALR